MWLCENKVINTDKIKKKRQLITTLNVIFSNILLSLHEIDPCAVWALALDLSYFDDDFLIHTCYLKPSKEDINVMLLDITQLPKPGIGKLQSRGHEWPLKLFNLAR